MAAVKVPIEVELRNAWLVQPGDKLVLGFAHRLTEAEMHEIESHLRDRLPGVEAVVIDCLSHMAVYRPDEAMGSVAAHRAIVPGGGEATCHCAINRDHEWLPDPADRPAEPLIPQPDPLPSGPARDYLAARPRSCPTCHGIFDQASGGCADTWHVTP